MTFFFPLKVILPAEEKVEGQPDRPDAVQLQISKLVVSNRRMEERMSRDDLKAALEQYRRARLFTSTDFPNDETKESEIIPVLMQDHALSKDNPYIEKGTRLFFFFVWWPNASKTNSG